MVRMPGHHPTACAVALGIAATISFPLTAGGGADVVIAGLQDQGYNVVINWLSGYDTKPLARCWVVGVNNPGNQPPDPTTLVTVYVDVRCPNNDDDGPSGAIGIGLG
jgi:hypothetical protein